MSYALNNEYQKREIEQLQQEIANLNHEKRVMRDVIYELQKRIKELEGVNDWKVEELK